MKIPDTDHAFLRPLPVRLAIVIFAFAWAAFEAWLGETVWALVFGCIAAYCAWALLPGFRKARARERNDG